MPSSKSLTQRYLALALLAGRDLRVERPLLSDDPLRFLDALAVAGFEIEHDTTARAVQLRAPATSGSADDSIRSIHCGAGGTMLRFLTAALTAVPGRWRLDGVPRLRERTVAPLVAALRGLGAEIACTEVEGFAPLEIEGGSLMGGRVVLDAGASSQFVSALLLAGTAAREPVSFEVSDLVSEPYVDLTLEAIEVMGGQASQAPGSFSGGTSSSWQTRIYSVEPGLDLARPEVVRIDADDSAIAYPAAAAALTGGRVVLTPVRAASRQGDRGFLELLERMGASLEWGDGETRGPNLSTDTLTVSGSGRLEAVDVDLGDMPDQVPTLAALAPFAHGITHITGVPHLRIKESDRLAAMTTELRRAGATVQELPDGLVIPGVWADAAPPTHPVSCESWDDHRIAMAMALVGLRRPNLTVREPEVVSKSYPGFWNDLARLLESSESE